MMPFSISFINTLSRASFMITALLFSVLGANATFQKTSVLEHNMLEQTMSDDTSYQQELLFVSTLKGYNICFIVLTERVSEFLNKPEDLSKDEKDCSNFKMSLKTTRKEFKEACRKVAEADKKMKACGGYGNNRDEERLF